MMESNAAEIRTPLQSTYLTAQQRRQQSIDLADDKIVESRERFAGCGDRMSCRRRVRLEKGGRLVRILGC